MQPEITITRIGEISHGIDGRDEYVRLRSADDCIDHQYAYNWLLEKCYHAGNHPRPRGPGGYFCHMVKIVPIPNIAGECIGIIYHRYDV